MFLKYRQKYFDILVMGGGFVIRVCGGWGFYREIQALKKFPKKKFLQSLKCVCVANIKQENLRLI
jgi:hypothetical protein